MLLVIYTQLTTKEITSMPELAYFDAYIYLFLINLFYFFLFIYLFLQRNLLWNLAKEEKNSLIWQLLPSQVLLKQLLAFFHFLTSRGIKTEHKLSNPTQTQPIFLLFLWENLPQLGESKQPRKPLWHISIYKYIILTHTHTKVYIYICYIPFCIFSVSLFGFWVPNLGTAKKLLSFFFSLW